MAPQQQTSTPRNAAGERERAIEADTEDALVQYVLRLDNAREGHFAIQFHLSRITRTRSGRKHLRIAASMLQELLDPLTRPPFILRNGDIVLINKEIDEKKIADSIEMLQYLLSGEPLVRAGGGKAALFTLYNLGSEYPQLLASVRQLVESQARADKARGLAAARQPAKSAVHSARVGELMERLGRLELANMVRQQTVWAIPPGERPQPLFDELSISVNGLREAIGLGQEIADDPQLFRLITRSLDKYMLSTLLRDRSAGKRPISINMNLQTLSSQEFFRFEHQRPLGWHGQIILEVQFADIWSDLPAFITIAHAMKETGFCCCIDGVTHSALPLVNFDRFEADFIKVIWDDALLQLDEASLRDVCRAFNACGKDRVILTRCGRQEALQFGLAANIRMFQGWHIDTIGREQKSALPPRTRRAS
jgi:EAL domain-containing protein (putative c-di-GMP-specific phosphodiesterase class I)